MGPPGTAGCGGPALHRQPDRQRFRQHLLLGGGAGRLEELVGLVLRLDRRRQLHHRRQAAAVDDAHGPVGAAVRPQLVEHPPAGGAGGLGHGRDPVRGGAAPVRTSRRDHRGAGDGAVAGRRPDLPLQQPGRPAHSAPGRRFVGLRPRPRGRPPALGRGGRRPRRPRLQHEVPAGLPGAARVCNHLRHRRGGQRPPADRGPPDGRARRGHQQRLVGPGGGAHPRGVAPLHRRQRHELRHPAAAGLRRPGPYLRRLRRRARGWRSRWCWRRLRWRDRGPSTVQCPVRRADQLAPAVLVDRPGKRAVAAAVGPPNRSPPGRLSHVGPVAWRPRDRLQLHVRDHPQLLRRRACSGDRCPGRGRVGRPVEPASASPLRRPRPRRRHRRQRRVGLDAARADARLRPRPGSRRPVGRRPDRPGRGAPGDDREPSPSTPGGRSGPRDPAGGSRGICLQDDGHGLCGRGPQRGPGDRDRRTRWPPRRVRQRRSGRGRIWRRTRWRLRRPAGIRPGRRKPRARRLPAGESGGSDLDRGHHVGPGGRLDRARQRRAGHGHGRVHGLRPRHPRLPSCSPTSPPGRCATCSSEVAVDSADRAAETRRSRPG